MEERGSILLFCPEQFFYFLPNTTRNQEKDYILSKNTPKMSDVTSGKPIPGIQSQPYFSRALQRPQK
jgi:hypothetical protein